MTLESQKSDTGSLASLVPIFSLNLISHLCSNDFGPVSNSPAASHPGHLLLLWVAVILWADECPTLNTQASDGSRHV